MTRGTTCLRLEKKERDVCEQIGGALDKPRTTLASGFVCVRVHNKTRSVSPKQPTTLSETASHMCVCLCAFIGVCACVHSQPDQAIQTTSITSLTHRFGVLFSLARERFGLRRHAPRARRVSLLLSLPLLGRRSCCCSQKNTHTQLVKIAFNVHMIGDRQHVRAKRPYHISYPQLFSHAGTNALTSSPDSKHETSSHRFPAFLSFRLIPHPHPYASPSLSILTLHGKRSGFFTVITKKITVLLYLKVNRALHPHENH